jgi:hypothetical protein
MDVDESWTDEEPFNIDDSVSFLFVYSANSAYPSVSNANLRLEPRVTGAVKDSAILQNKIVNVGCRLLASRRLGGSFAHVCTGGQGGGAS